MLFCFFWISLKEANYLDSTSFAPKWRTCHSTYRFVGGIAMPLLSSHSQACYCLISPTPTSTPGIFLGQIIPVSTQLSSSSSMCTWDSSHAQEKMTPVNCKFKTSRLPFACAVVGEYQNYFSAAKTVLIHPQMHNTVLHSSAHLQLLKYSKIVVITVVTADINAVLIATVSDSIRSVIVSPNVAHSMVRHHLSLIFIRSWRSILLWFGILWYLHRFQKVKLRYSRRAAFPSPLCSIGVQSYITITNTTAFADYGC